MAIIKVNGLKLDSDKLLDYQLEGVCLVGNPNWFFSEKSGSFLIRLDNNFVFIQRGGPHGYSCVYDLRQINLANRGLRGFPTACSIVRRGFQQDASGSYVEGNLNYSDTSRLWGEVGQVLAK